MIENGVGLDVAERRIRDRLSASVLYGYRDDIRTGIQNIVQRNAKAVAYIFNPWRELMGGQYLGDTLVPAPNNAFEVVQSNPRDGVERFRDLYAVFANLPQSLQEDFFGMLKYYPCTLSDVMCKELVDDSNPIVDRIVSSIKRATPREHRRAMRFVLDALAWHNICVDKEEIVRNQLEDLLGYNISTIPTAWTPGHLKPATIEQKSAELNALLERMELIRR